MEQNVHVIPLGAFTVEMREDLGLLKNNPIPMALVRYNAIGSLPNLEAPLLSKRMKSG